MGLHDGHRERMLSKFEKNGFGIFEEHEKLEMILFYGVPRRNTNELAHELLNKYHTIANVMDAPKRELLKFNGFSERTYQLFKVIKDTYALYEFEKQAYRTYMTTIDEFASFFQLYFMGEKQEKVAIVCLDSLGKVLKTQKIGSGNTTETFFNMQEIVKILMDTSPTQVVIAHNHPGDDPHPSQSDINSTIKIKDSLELLGIRLKDHFIVTESGCHSMAREKKTAEIFKPKETKDE